MHIPDGYLSPSTCAVLYAGAAPFWVIALKRVRRVMSAQLVPLISLVAAFCFVVMMFNLPLPGGTTGHAVGMGIATIVLGPWVSILAISVALLIQAIFFGDGGITTYGANCMNMAIIGSLVVSVLYRAISGSASIDSARRIVAAAVAGYVAINVSALSAAIQLGIQPALFHDASGAPLYAPYPLNISVPAMLIGHLTFAGLGEAVISGGIVAYFQRANPSLLQATSGLNIAMSGWRMTRPLWIGLAALMILTPLGLLAAGTAWGEWVVEDYKDPKAREEMATASHNLAPPTEAPKGLERLSSIWTAPMPDYAPPFLKSKELGYVMSAMMGTGLIILAFLFLDAIQRVRGRGSKDTATL
jgi:cobalt/nickel transport system permease protein